MPAHPAALTALEKWYFQRRTDSPNPKVVYPILYGNLLIARGLLASHDLERQRVGLFFARYTNLTARLNLQDYGLNARICEAFLVPHLDIAFPENGHTVSRRQIMEDTYNAYAGVGDTPREETTLLFLLRYADSPNTLNWTRLMLAQTYEKAGNYGQAIAYVQVTNPLNKDWLAQLQQKQAQKQAKQTPPAPPKSSHTKAPPL